MLEPVATSGAPTGATPLPAALAPLRELAQNLRWCWHRPALEVFRSLDGSLWEQSGHNPVRMLAIIDPLRIAAAAGDPAFVAELRRQHDDLRAYLAAPAESEAARRSTDRRLLLGRVRHHRVPPDLRRRPRDPGRRPPQGLVRPGRAAHRRRPHVPRGLLPPAPDGRRPPAGAVRGRPLRGAAGRPDARRRRRRGHRRGALPRPHGRGPGVDGRGRAACTCTCSTPTTPPTTPRTAGSPSTCTAATSRPACARRSSSASAATGPSRRSASDPHVST